MDIDDLQATVTAGSCSSRVIFNVPEGAQPRRRAGVRRRAERELRLRDLGQLQQLGAAVDADLDRSPAGTSASSRASRRATACRPCRRSRSRAPATYQWHVTCGRASATSPAPSSTPARASRRSATRASGFGTVNLNSFAPNTIGGPLTAEHVHVRPRAAVVHARQPARRRCCAGAGTSSLYGNNLTDERAFLALDQERGTRARVGYLTNQPRTFGLDGPRQLLKQRRLLRLTGAAGAVAVLTAGGSLPVHLAQLAAVHADLVTLFHEWREFQKPVFRDGVPDYTPAAMAEQQAPPPGIPVAA